MFTWVEVKMNIWNQDKYIKGWNFASLVHNGQRVPGTEVPYINHIGLVAMEALSAIAQSDEISAPDLLVLCALLHDTIEDTNTSFEDIKKEFGSDIANGVMALSKDKNLSTKEEQMVDSLQRIKKQPKEVWMVKLSDRITNLQPPPEHWGKAKITKYKHEATTILNALGTSNKYLAERLRFKIDEYQKYE